MYQVQKEISRKTIRKKNEFDGRIYYETTIGEGSHIEIYMPTVIPDDIKINFDQPIPLCIEELKETMREKNTCAAIPLIDAAPWNSVLPLIPVETEYEYYVVLLKKDEGSAVDQDILYVSNLIPPKSVCTLTEQERVEVEKEIDRQLKEKGMSIASLLT